MSMTPFNRSRASAERSAVSWTCTVTNQLSLISLGINYLSELDMYCDKSVISDQFSYKLSLITDSCISNIMDHYLHWCTVC